MAGGAIGRGVVVDLGQLRDPFDLDRDTRSIRAGAGVLRGEINIRARRDGLRFPVDPSSGAFCTIGGMSATNAAGAHSLIHGPTRPWVLALECVFADGSTATVRRGEPAPMEIEAIRRFINAVQPDILSWFAERGHRPGYLKSSSGYAIDVFAQTLDLVDLLVGSEGTLALFTAVEIALIPLAAATGSMFVSFRELERGVEAAIMAREHGVAACELLDRTFLTIAAEAGKPLPAPANTEAALLIEVEAGDPGEAAASINRLRELLVPLGASESVVAIDAGEEAELWNLRHAASPAIAKLHPKLRSMQFIEDAAVPPPALAEYVRGVREILASNETAGVIFGHAGDAHVHVNPLIDVSNPDWRQRLESILLAVTDLVGRLGGTLTGEHGDGRLRTPLLDRVRPRAELEIFAAIKQAFDPDALLNPGVKVPLANQRAIDVIKYDPDGASLPPAARRALEIVEKEKAYARHRLDLL